MQFKYILFAPPDHLSPEIGVAFSPLLQHKEVAKGLGKVPLSAGFIEVGPKGVRTFGASDSLGLRAQEQDAIHFEHLSVATAR